VEGTAPAEYRAWPSASTAMRSWGTRPPRSSRGSRSPCPICSGVPAGSAKGPWRIAQRSGRSPIRQAGRQAGRPIARRHHVPGRVRAAVALAGGPAPLRAT